MLKWDWGMGCTCMECSSQQQQQLAQLPEGASSQLMQPPAMHKDHNAALQVCSLEEWHAICAVHAAMMIWAVARCHQCGGNASYGHSTCHQ